MKKNKKTQRPFEAQIRQMRRNKCILVNLVNVKAFTKACNDLNIDLGVGSSYKGGIILYEK